MYVKLLLFAKEGERGTREGEREKEKGAFTGQQRRRPESKEALSLSRLELLSARKLN
jgi:hypothetical protein